MTNVTLSIEETVYKKMKKYSEIKWSEFIRKMINKRITQLENIKELDESALTMLASEEVLKKDWNNEYDERWNNV